jgi:hypothetical protein
MPMRVALSLPSPQPNANPQYRRHFRATGPRDASRRSRCEGDDGGHAAVTRRSRGHHTEAHAADTAKTRGVRGDDTKNLAQKRRIENWCVPRTEHGRGVNCW